MTKLFSNSSPKVLKSVSFGNKFKDFYLYTIFCNNTYSRVLNLNMTIAFWNFYPKHSNKALLVAILGIFILPQNYAIRKIREHWLQLWQQYFKSQPKTSQIWNFCSQAYSTFILVPNMEIWKTWGCWFQLQQKPF